MSGSYSCLERKNYERALSLLLSVPVRHPSIRWCDVNFKIHPILSHLCVGVCLLTVIFISFQSPVEGQEGEVARRARSISSPLPLTVKEFDTPSASASEKPVDGQLSGQSQGGQRYCQAGRGIVIRWDSSDVGH